MGCEVTSNMTSLVVLNLPGALKGREMELVQNCRAQGFGIVHEGRVVVYYTYETDLGNGWEDADRYKNPPEARENAFRMGVNIFLYAMSQVTP